MRLLDKVLRRNERVRETVATYRSVFGGPQGPQVFLWIVERCGLFRRIETEEQRVLHNWGIELFENMGLTQGMNYKALVESILKFSIPDEALDESQKE